MPRSANTLSALNSAPGSFASVNTIDVLSGAAVDSGRRPTTRKRVMLLLVVLDADDLSGVEPEHLGGAGRGDGRGVGQLLRRAIIFALPAVS